eukprot:CAMPEP_0115729190 /NCGR_PEP_ID=MMETSP0272-20121206/83370_1 /TAXON_ID=71861 /ORGANISM="Scrippsiella trochoidea, Strain CCMP3099" /LENGTH=165 /DNA_ID=CAMNT_0003172845 /DNA_START=184 /DNA_END=678 /DNA_ORIENTATION=-
MAAQQVQQIACVFGASGFIGKKAVEVLLSAGFRYPASIDGALEGCCVAVNCAGIYRWWLPNPSEYQEVNVEGAANVARACLKAEAIHRLVHISTAMAYGYPADRPFREESKVGPHASEYARTKHLGDERVASLCHGSSSPMLVAPDTNYIYVHIKDVQKAILAAS